MLAKKNPVASCCVCAVLFVVLLSGCTPPGPRALLRGKQLLEQGSFPEAVEKLKLATSLMNTNAQAWNYLGLAYQNAGDVTNAALAYGQALKLNRDLVEAHFNLGCLWLQQNRFENAKPELAAFVLRRPAETDGWLKLASAQMRSRELIAAEKSFNEVLRLSPQNPEALNGLGMVQVQRNRPRDAAQFFNAALKQQPGYAPAILNLAIVLQAALNDKPGALQRYRQYLALTPRPANWNAVNATAKSLEQELNPPSRPVAPVTVAPAVSNPPPIRVAVTAPPRQTPTPKQETVPSNLKNSPPLPTQRVETVKVESQPEARIAQDVSNSSGSTSDAAATDSERVPAPKRGFLQRINPLNLFKHSPKETMPVRVTSTATLNHSGSPAATGSTPVGIPRYNYHKPSKPASGDRALAEKFFADGLREHKSLHYPEAVRAYHKAVEADPGYFEAYYNLSIAALASGNLPDALSAGELALAIRPDSSEARLTFAQALKQAGYLFDAANELATVLARNPDEPRAHLALGNLYAQEFRQPEKARQHYVKVLDLDPQNPQAGAIREWIVAHPTR
jgi:Flp pilus assembly protein TadD